MFLAQIEAQGDTYDVKKGPRDHRQLAGVQGDEEAGECSPGRQQVARGAAVPPRRCRTESALSHPFWGTFLTVRASE